MIKRKTSANKQQIISEYLSGQDSYQALSVRYGVNARTIQTWVRAFRKHHTSFSNPSAISPAQQLPLVQQQLEQLALKNELLQEMLRLAEEHTGIDITKKYGTRQS
jgi:transposase-like protein